MAKDWSSFYTAVAGAAAALTGLLFVAVSLRPAEIRGSPLMVGRARSAFLAFATVMFLAFLSTAPVSPRVVGASQLVVAATALGMSIPFTMTAHRSGALNYPRATGYHLGLLLGAVAGAVRAVAGFSDGDAILLAGHPRPTARLAK